MQVALTRQGGRVEAASSCRPDPGWLVAQLPAASALLRAQQHSQHLPVNLFLLLACRLYQRCVFRLAPRQQHPLPLRAGITLAPAGGLWVTAHERSSGGWSSSGMVGFDVEQ